MRNNADFWYPKDYWTNDYDPIDRYDNYKSKEQELKEHIESVRMAWKAPRKKPDVIPAGSWICDRPNCYAINDDNEGPLCRLCGKRKKE